MAINIPGVTMMSSDDVPNDYGRYLIHGPQGSGKTTLASTIAKLGKTLYVDFTGEKGIRSFRNSPQAKNITVARPSSITALDDLFWELDKGNHEFKAVVLDSLTSIQKMTMRFLLGHDETAVREIRQGTAPADFQTWGRSLEVLQDTATFWYGLADANRDKPMHVVMTAQTKVIDNEVTGETMRMPDVQKGALSIVQAVPDYILYTDVEENMDAMGDESQPLVNYIVRFGSHPGYSTKARIPQDLRGKIPSILGRKNSTDLTNLSRSLGIGGVPAKRSTAKKTESTNN